jgi:hypothetical protein
MTDPVEIQAWYRVCSELKVMSCDKLKVILHEPLLQQLRFREVIPNRFFGVGEEKLVFDSVGHNG